MVSIPPIEGIGRRYVRGYVRGSLEAFIEGKKNLNWIIGVIGRSGILQYKYKGMLQEIFDDLQDYKKAPRYQEILKECQIQKWL